MFGCLGAAWVIALTVGCVMSAPFPVLGSQLDSARRAAPRPIAPSGALAWSPLRVDAGHRSPARGTASIRG
jgi:hypothetical protein